MQFAALLVILLSFSHCGTEEVQLQPNILFIAVDDLKPMLNCYGESQIHSPAIDQIAGGGTVFMNNHCQQAVCGPSRASLMTGLRPDRTDVRDLKTKMRDMHPDILSLPQHLRNHGYVTSAFGKIYDPRCVGPNYDSLSWTIPYKDNKDLELPQGISPPMFGHYQDPVTREKGEVLLAEAEEMGLTGYARVRHGLSIMKPVVERVDVPDNAYYDGIMVEGAIRMMEKLARQEDPFFLAVGFKKPHLPFVAPSKYWDLYEENDISLAPFRKMSKNGPRIAYHKSGELRSYTGFDFINDNIPDEQQREIIHGYYAAVSYIDALIGKLIAKLNDYGLSKNTIIVLWGDHGWHLGDHNLWCKHSNFEQATRSPLIISLPGGDEQRNINTPTEFVDIFPTLCDLAGISTPENLDGMSLAPLVRGSGSVEKKYAVSQFSRGRDVMGYSIRTDRYRYTEWHSNKYLSTKMYDPENIVAKEFYDYELDPDETENGVSDPDNQAAVAAHAELLKAFLVSQQKETNEKL